MPADAPGADPNEPTKGGNAKLIVAGVVAAALMVLVWVFRVRLQSEIRSLQDWIQGAGWIGVIVYILSYAIATVAFLPGWILTVGGGLVFGLVKGSLLASVSSVLGATCAFVLGRSLLRSTVEKKISGSESFSAIDRAIAERGWKIVLLIRLSPAFPFNLLNYALGLTSVRLDHYIFASWIGMFPGTVMYVYLGSLGDFFASDREKTVFEKVALFIGLLATVAVSIFVARVARNALRESSLSAAEGESGPSAE